MQTFLRGVALGIVVLGLAGVQLPAQETDPLVGTWELNVAKSKYSPGPAPQSETRTYVVSGEDIKATVKRRGQRRKADRCRIHDQLRRQGPSYDRQSRRRYALAQTCQCLHCEVYAEEGRQGCHYRDANHLPRWQSDDNHDQRKDRRRPDYQRRGSL